VNVKDTLRSLCTFGHATTNQKEVTVGNEDNTATGIATMMAAKQQALNDHMRAYNQMAALGNVAGTLVPTTYPEDRVKVNKLTPVLRPTIKGIKNGWLLEVNGEEIYCADIAAVGSKITAMLAEFSLRD